MRVLDRYAHGNRWRDRHPAEKLVLALGLIAAALGGAPVVTAPLVLAVAVAAAVWGAGIPLRVFLVALAVPAGFILTGAPMLMVGLDGGGFHFRPEAAPETIALVLRGLAASAGLILLALTTPVADLACLLGRLRVPMALIEVTMLTYRFVFAIAETAQNIRTAQAARLGYHGTRRSARSLGLLASMLLQRSLAKARALELGLAARGLDGGFPTLARAWRSSPAAWFAIAVTLTGLFAVGWMA